MNNLDKQSKMDELVKQILADNACPDLANGATQLVVGAGSLDSDIMFVGEAPGAKEDQQGTPFIGAAGKFLSEMLDSINLSRDDVYITNIVKYRPPNNRDPLPEEKATFLPYLEQEVAIIKPKIIATLGRHSMNSFMPKLKISDVHGQQQQHNGQLYLPLYHPAAALYNGSLRKQLLDDFAQIPKILEQIN